MNNLGSWNTERNGSGTAATAFASSHSFIIQSGQNPTANAGWTTTTGPKFITIETGASMSSGAFNPVVSLTLEGSGAYTVSNSSFTNLEVVAAASTSSLIFAQPSGSASITNVSGTFGNLEWNSSSTTNTTIGSFSAAGHVTINGSSDARLLASSGTTDNTWTIGGNLTISSSKVVDLGAGASATGVINLSGDLTNGGTLKKSSGNGTAAVNFTGTSPSNVTWGTVTNNNFGSVTFTVTEGKTLIFIDSLNGGATTFVVNGTLDLGNNSIAGTNGVFTLANGATLITASATGLDGAITVTGTRTFSTEANYEFRGAGTGTALPSTVNNLTIDRAAGSVTLDGNTATQVVSGVLNVHSGSLSAGAVTNAISVGSLTMSDAQIDSGLSVSLNGNVTFDAVNDGTATVAGSMNLGGASRTFSIANGTATQDMVVSGAISNGSVIKSGTGNLVFTGNNTYSGGTTISAGTLTAGHDNALGTGSVIVNTGGTLAIGDNVTIGNAIQLDGGALQGLGEQSKFSGTLSGSGTLTGPLTLTESAVYQWHLNSASTSGANALSIATGTLTIADGAKIALSFGAGEGVSPVAGGFWDVTQTWTVISKGESGSIIASSVAVADDNKSAWNDLGNFQVALESGSLVLIWTPHVAAIPEPSTYAAWLGAAALVSAGWYRRRQRAAKA